MDIFIIILLGIYYVAMLMGCFLLYYTTFINKKRSVSQVHFYVARDKDGKLWLYLGKPKRSENYFSNDIWCISENYVKTFKALNISPKDYITLKWCDGPVEEFPKIKD